MHTLDRGKNVYIKKSLSSNKIYISNYKISNIYNGHLAKQSKVTINHKL